MLSRADSVERGFKLSLTDRILGTLRLFRDWGHAPTLDQLSEFLLGGRERGVVLRDRLTKMEDPVVEGEIVGLAGWEDLIAKTADRVRSHEGLKAEFLAVAEEFTEELVASCPFVESVALAGSLATDGFDVGDDIDFDLIVQNGTRYIAYLLATLIGIKYAWRYRDRRPSEMNRTPLLPKITCVNVVWSEGQTRPFLRQDDALAFELIRCRPLYGSGYFSRMLGENQWINTYFPQLFERVFEERVQRQSNLLGRLLSALGRHPLALAIVEAVSRGIAWALYSFVQRARRRSPKAVARIEFLRKVKRPYEVFQD